MQTMLNLHTVSNYHLDHRVFFGFFFVFCEDSCDIDFSVMKGNNTAIIFIGLLKPEWCLFIIFQSRSLLNFHGLAVWNSALSHLGFLIAFARREIIRNTVWLLSNFQSLPLACEHIFAFDRFTCSHVLAHVRVINKLWMILSWRLLIVNEIYFHINVFLRFVPISFHWWWVYSSVLGVWLFELPSNFRERWSEWVYLLAVKLSEEDSMLLCVEVMLCVILSFGFVLGFSHWCFREIRID